MKRSFLTPSVHHLLALAALPLGAFACSGGATPDAGAEHDGEATAAIVVPSSPITEAAITPLPALGLHGHPPSSATTATAATDIHGAEFANGTDLAAAPVTDRTTWASSVTSVAHATSGPIGSELGHALDLAFAERAPVGSTLESAVGLPPGTIPTTTKFEGYSPVRQRWMKSQYIPGSGFLSSEVNEVYTDPQLASENRERGARLYCAARTVQAKQAATGRTSMGQKALATVRLFGSNIDFLVIEPTAVLEGPRMLDPGTPDDGAQAFEVPMLFGNRITPIRGIGLPGFPEVRSPLTFVTADSEVVTPTDERSIQSGYTYTCDFSGCHIVPRYAYGPSRAYQTVTHADAIVSAEQDVNAPHVDIPLFTIGPVSAKLGFDLGLKVGGLNTPTNQRLLSGAFPSPVRTGDVQSYLTRSFDDDPWSIGSTGEVDTTYSVLHPAPGGAINLTHIDPFLARALQNDDHILQKETGVDLQGTLSAGLALGLPGLSFSATVNGYVKVGGGAVHEVRDELLVHDGKVAATDLLVTPLLEGHVNAGAYLDLALQFLFFRLEKVITLIPDTTLASTTSRFDEQNRLRIGLDQEYSANLMTQPASTSHLPSDGYFPSFPGDVSACLADTTTPPAPPAPCAGAPATGVAPHAEICIVERPITGTFPANVCSVIDSYAASLGLSAAQTSCIASSLHWVCGSGAYQSSFSASTVLHVPGSDTATFGDIGHQCQLAGIDPAALFDTDVCDGTGRPFSKNNSGIVIGPGGTTTEPGSCH